MKTEYKDPVVRLLEIGETVITKEWLDYREYGMTAENIPELIKMATDMELNLGDPDSMEVWAPLHAWRALGQLQAVEAINPLINMFHELEDDDWLNDDMPKVFAMIGAQALPALAVYLRYDARNVFPRICAADCILSIGLKHQEVKEKSARILVDQLKLYRKNDPSLNGFLVHPINEYLDSWRL